MTPTEQVATMRMELQALRDNLANTRRATARMVRIGRAASLVPLGVAMWGVVNEWRAVLIALDLVSAVVCIWSTERRAVQFAKWEAARMRAIERLEQEARAHAASLDVPYGP